MPRAKKGNTKLKESADSRITKLCTVVSRAELANWIGGRDRFFEVLPVPSVAQRLLCGTQVFSVALSLTNLAVACRVILEDWQAEALATELAAMPPTSEFPVGFWRKYPIDVILEQCDQITQRIGVTGKPSAAKLVGMFNSDRCVKSGATEMSVAVQIAEALRESLTVILYGDSGSGKTTAMLLAAVALADTMKEKVPLAHFALYTDLMGIEGSFRAIEATQITSENSRNSASAACKLLVKELRVHQIGRAHV